MKNTEITTRSLTFGALFCAMIYISTTFLVLPLPSNMGYYHLGDTMVLLSGALLGPFFGPLSAALASSLSDVSLGYSIYTPATLIVKGLMSFWSAKMIKKESKLGKKIVFAIVALLTLVGGYFIYESILTSPQVAIASIIPNAIQGSIGILFFFIIYSVLPEINIRG